MSEETDFADAGPDSVELSKAGFRALEEQDIPSAEEKFRLILKSEPENCYAFVGLAECEKKRKDLPAAARWYERCLASDTGNEVSIRGLVMCYADMNRHKKVTELYEAHTALLQGSDSIVLKAADAFRKLHNTDMAAVLYQLLLEKDRANRYALSGMAHLLYEEERYKEATKYWQRLLAVDPRNVIAHTCIGNCCRKMRNFENGLEYYRMADEIEPGNSYALFGLGDCCRGLKRFQQSLTYWQRILESDPTNRMILTRAGEACFRLNRDDDARSYLEEALGLGEDLYALMGMARLSKSQGKEGEAKGFYERASGIEGSKSRFGPEIASFLTKD